MAQMHKPDERDVAHAGKRELQLSRRRRSPHPPEFRQIYETCATSCMPRRCRSRIRADGLIKHLVHDRLNTRECCIEAYMQFLKPAAANPASTVICGKK